MASLLRKVRLRAARLWATRLQAARLQAAQQSLLLEVLVHQQATRQQAVHQQADSAPLLAPAALLASLHQHRCDRLEACPEYSQEHLQ